MNKYEHYQFMKEVCQEIAKSYAEAEDCKLTTFYMNAAEGYRRKAEDVDLYSLNKIKFKIENITVCKAIKGLIKSFFKNEESTVMYFQWQLARSLGIEK